MSTLLTRRTALAGLTLAGLALAGCGFALRKPPQYAFERIALDLPPGGNVRAMLTRALQLSPRVRVIPESGDRQAADVVLEMPAEVREKVVTGMSAAGQVREVQLRLRQRLRLRTPAGLELLPMTELLLERELSYSETAAQAKEEEEALLYRDMRQDMLQQVLRRLAAVRSLQAPAAPLPH